MSDVRRYEMVGVTRCGEGWQELQKSPDGDWMCYEDHAARVAALEQEIERLKAEAAIADEMYEAQQVKFDGCPRKHDEPCACSFDKPGDVCSVHSPALRRAEAELTAMRTRAERAEAAREAKAKEPK